MQPPEKIRPNAPPAEPGTSVEERIEALIRLGLTPEDIARVARKISVQSTEDYFLDELKTGSPPDWCIQVSVTDWECIVKFFAKPPTEKYHPQRMFRDITADINNAIEKQDALRLVLSIMLAMKAVRT